MTRTTELLKEIEVLLVDEYADYPNYSVRDLIKSELKGRLDALKDEEKFLDELEWVINGNVTPELQKYVNKELASIQEEIKLIEEGI